MATRSKKVIDNFNRMCDVIFENLPNDIAINVSVYVRDKSQECRISEETMDGDIESRFISKGLMHYDIKTICSMNYERDHSHISNTPD